VGIGGSLLEVVMREDVVGVTSIEDVVDIVGVTLRDVERVEEPVGNVARYKCLVSKYT